MAVPFIIQRRHIAVKIETTEGTDAVPTDTDVIAPAYDIEYTPTFEMFEREILQASFSRLTQIAGERSAVISFAVELKGANGAVDAVAGHLSAPLKACGMAETVNATTNVTYAPASSFGTNNSVTIEIRTSTVGTEAQSTKILGARGTFSIEATKGDVILVRFEFTGKYVEPTTVSVSQFVTPSPGATPLAFLNAAFSYDAVSTLKIQNATLDIGNTVSLRNDVNDAEGNRSAIIVARSPVGSIDPELDLTTIFNSYNRLTSETEGILTYTLNGGTGNTVVVTAPKVQIVNIAQGDRDGLRIQTLDLQLSQSVAAGDDELTIVTT